MARTHHPLILALLSALALASFALYARDSSVVDLTADNFASLVIPTPKVWLVEFYAPWCGHCKNFAKDYAKAAENLQGIVNVGAVDCDADKNKPLCGTFGVQGFPTVKLFKSEPEFKALEKGQRGMSKTPIDYQGPRTAGAVAKWALGFLPDNVRSLTTKNIKEFEEMPHNKALLFSEKEAHSNLLKALALDFDEKAASIYPARTFLPIGQISHDEKEIVEKYGVMNFPSLLVLKGDGTVERFTEDFKYERLHQFLKTHSNEISASSREQERQPPPPEPAAPAKLYHAVDQESFDEACKPQGLCLVFFLDPSSSEHDKYLSILESLVEKYKTFRFVWIDGVAHGAVKEQFYVADGLPQALALQRKSLRVRYYKSGFEEELLEEFLDSVKSGKGRTASLDADPKWPSRTSDEL